MLVKSKRRAIVLVVFSVLLVGAALETCEGFPVAKRSTNVYLWLGGVFLFGIIYLLGEAGAGWIGSKDRVSQPLPRRALNLFFLLGFEAFFYLLVFLVLRLVEQLSG